MRSGPLHNQLLPPLTPYIALCGAQGPASFHIPIEHFELLNRLCSASTADRQTSQAEIAELGLTMQAVLSNIPGFQFEVARASGDGKTTQASDGQDLINVGVRLTGSELAHLPFEMAVSFAD